MRYAAELRFEYGTERHACAVERALGVDEELNPAVCLRSSRVEGSAVVVSFKAVDAKQLRVSVGGFFELAAVASETVAAFG